MRSSLIRLVTGARVGKADATALEAALLLNAAGAVVGLGAAVAAATEDPALDCGALLEAALLTAELLAAALLEAGAVVGFGAAVGAWVGGGATVMVDGTGVGGAAQPAASATSTRSKSTFLANGNLMRVLLRVG